MELFVYYKHITPTPHFFSSFRFLFAQRMHVVQHWCLISLPHTHPPRYTYQYANTISLMARGHIWEESAQLGVVYNLSVWFWDSIYAG